MKHRIEPRLDRKVLKKFLSLAGEKLTGNWVLIGGTLLPVLGSEFRTTLDIDLIGLTDKEKAQALQLMEIAEDLGLPVETINQAGALFLHRIRDFQTHLVPLHQGTRATIYRPDIALYIQLKIQRLTETDLTDCLEYIKLAHRLGEAVDRKALSRLLKRRLDKNPTPEKLSGLKRLLSELESIENNPDKRLKTKRNPAKKAR